MLTKRNICTF